MRSTLFVLVTGYVLLIVETSWGAGLRLGQIRLDGIVALLVWHGFHAPVPHGLIPVLGLGILAGLFSDLPTGLFPLAYAIGYLLVRYILDHVICTQIWQKALLVFFVSFGVMVILQTGSGAAELVWPWGIAQAMVNGALAPVWFWCFDLAALFARRVSQMREQE